MNVISNYATKILLGILIAALLFHFAILVKMIPYDITWGGRLKNDAEMYTFETISILINAFLAWVLLMKGNYTKHLFPSKAINIILWVFFTIFALNTVGNIFAKTTFEKLFAIVTALLAFLIWVVLKRKPATHQ
jgi:hypothetical protein